VTHLARMGPVIIQVTVTAILDGKERVVKNVSWAATARYQDFSVPSP